MKREELDAVLLAHRRWLDSEGVEGKRADLSNANLMGADLSEVRLHSAKFEGAYLRGCNLKGANLNDARFSVANLNRADLSNASLFGADLQGASLILAELHRTDLQGADLSGANLNRANLEDAYLFGANLQGGKLNRANLTRANLGRADLTSASLFRANLQGALLVGSNLSEANLQEAKLGGATLQKATLRKARLNQADFEQPERVGKDESPERVFEQVLKPANLADASFQEVDFSDARLSDVVGLQSHQLRGADLSNAKLPQDLKTFEGLGQVEELSRNARIIFVGLIGSCVFSWLTIATTTDAALLTRSAFTPLPIIQTKVPIAGFYLAAPVVLLALYFYLHLYLQNLWESLASLPAIFPDGRKLDQRAYPWILMSLVRVYVPMLKRDPQSFSTLKFLVSIVSAWCLVPFTLAFFWFRYLPRHDWFGLVLLTLVLLTAVHWGRVFFLRAKKELCSNGSVRSDNIGGAIKLSAAAAFIAIPISVWTMIGDERQKLSLLGFTLYADLEDADLSTKPASWTGVGTDIETEAQIAQVKGADLTNSDLRLAYAPGAFMVKAKLNGANLRGAFLVSADLRRAQFNGANLNRANLSGADLRLARGLTQAQLENSCGDGNTRLPPGLKIKSCPPGDR